MMNFATAAFFDLAKGDLDHKESDAVGDSLIMITPTTQRAPLSYGNIWPLISACQHVHFATFSHILLNAAHKYSEKKMQPEI